MARPTRWERIRRVSPLVWDGVLAVVVLTITASSLATTHALTTGSAWLLTAMLCLPLVVRRRYPTAVLAVVSVATVGFAIAGDGAAPEIALALAVYTVAAHRPWREVATIGLPCAVVGALAALVRTQVHGNWVEVLVGLIAWVGFPVLLGRILFTRRERIARDHESAAKAAVAEERTRIARELHDVVAHAISVMVVQAGAARTVVDRDPQAAKDAIAKVEETGRAGLVEMRRLITVLTEEDGTASTMPQPGLAQLDPLLRTMRDAGLAVEVVRLGDPRPLAPGVDLAAYRVIQESLTNVLKHAGSASARVVVAYAGDRLSIDVEDDGRGPAGGDGTGHGLIGMAERVKVVGGTLETGPRTGGGFVVRARIPIEVTS